MTVSQDTHKRSIIHHSLTEALATEYLIMTDKEDKIKSSAVCETVPMTGEFLRLTKAESIPTSTDMSRALEDTVGVVAFAQIQISA